MACDLLGNEIDWDLLSQRFGEIAFLLSIEDVPLLQVFQDEEGYLHAQGAKGALYEKDVKKELLTWKSQIIWDGVDVIYIYGVGLGTYYWALQSWLHEKKERVCIFLEDDLCVLQTLFHLKVGACLLKDPQVHFCYIADPSQWDRVLDECALKWMSNQVEFTSLASYAKGCAKQIKSLREQILRKSTLVHIGISESLHYHVLMGNIIANFLQTPHAFHVNKLQDICKGIPAIICGAGVSLAQAAQMLQMLDQKAVIIAGGSAITALSHMGIVPHIAMALDPNDEEYERLKASSIFEIPFVFSARLNKRVLSSIHVRPGYICSDTGGPLETWMQAKIGIDPDSLGPELGVEALSVTTLAIPLARYLGCRKILLCGVDLSYCNMQRYPSGVVPSAEVFFDELQSEKRSMEKVVYKRNGKGKKILSLIKWVMEASCIGAYVQSHPDMEFFTASDEGLPIEGVLPISMEEFSWRYCQNQHDVRGLIHAESTRACFSHFSEKEVKNVLQHLAASLEKSLSFFDSMDAEIDRKLAQDPSCPVESGLMSLIEADLQQEDGFEACLQYTFAAYQRLLDRYYPCFLSVETPEGRRVFLEKKKQLWQECFSVTQACLNEVKKFLL